jgi:hypothetical protein
MSIAIPGFALIYPSSVQRRPRTGREGILSRPNACDHAATPVGGSQQTHNPCDRLEAACCAVKNTYNK